LQNPYSRRYREGRAFQRLLEDLAKEQGAATFQDLSPRRRLLTYRVCILQFRLAMDDAEVIADPTVRARNEDRMIAYTNALVRLAALIGSESVNGQMPDGDILEALRGASSRQRA
jgi:plasmid stabilization system protein ParE